MKHYAKRSPMELDLAGGHYERHVSAMTSEGLHEKSDIAAELAWRDLENDRLRREVKRLRALFVAEADR